MNLDTPEKLIAFIENANKKLVCYHYKQNEILEVFQSANIYSIKNNLGMNENRRTNTPIVVDDEELWFSDQETYYNAFVMNKIEFGKLDRLIKFDDPDIQYYCIDPSKFLKKGRTIKAKFRSKQSGKIDTNYNWTAFDLDLLRQEIKNGYNAGVERYQKGLRIAKKLDILRPYAKTRLGIVSTDHTDPNHIAHLQLTDTAMVLSSCFLGTRRLDYESDKFMEIFNDYLEILSDYKIKINDFYEKWEENWEKGC